MVINYIDNIFRDIKRTKPKSDAKYINYPTLNNANQTVKDHHDNRWGQLDPHQDK